MILKMYLNGVELDSVVILPGGKDKDHLDVYKRNLVQKHAVQLMETNVMPQFVLEGVPSRMNKNYPTEAGKREGIDQNNPLFPKSKKHKE